MAGFYVLVAVQFLLFSVVIQGRGSDLTMTAQPSEPVELMTQLEITCTVEHQSYINEVNRSHAATSGYYPYYMYILNGKRSVLATISMDKPPEVKHDKERLKVESQISSQEQDSRNKPYLKLIWKRSKQNLSGKYVCIAHARDEEGHETLFMSEREIFIGKPNFDEILNYLNKEAIALDKMDYKNEMYYKEQINTFKYFAENLTDIKSSLWRNRQDISEIKFNITAHVESDTIWCGDNYGGFPKLERGSWRSKEIPVLFKTPFNSPPIVTYGLRLLDADGDPTVRVFVAIGDVTKQGFKFTCATWYVSKVYGAQVVWWAFNR